MTEERKPFASCKNWPVIDREGPRGERHVWAIPYGGALGRVVLYRKDLFDKPACPTPPTTGIGIPSIVPCRVLTQPERGIYAWEWPGQTRVVVLDILSLVAGGDALVMTKPIAGGGRFRQSRGAIALDFYTQLCTEPWTDKQGRRRYGYVLKDASEAYARWERGQIGMMFAYIDSKLFSVSIPMSPAWRRCRSVLRPRGAELNTHDGPVRRHRQSRRARRRMGNTFDSSTAKTPCASKHHHGRRRSRTV
jgi:hypothetical protein